MSSQPRKKLLEVEPAGGATVVRFTCQAIMGHEMVLDIGEQLGELIDRTPQPRLLLNFQGVEFITSSMLAKLLTIRKKTENAGGRLALCSVAPDVQHVFKLTHFDQMLTLYPDEQEALKAL